MLRWVAVLANSVGDDELGLVERFSDLSRSDVRRALGGLQGRLRRPPDSLWSSPRGWFVPQHTGDDDEHEAVVPLWTDIGAAPLAIRVRFTPAGFEDAVIPRIIAFEAAESRPEWVRLPPDAARLPEPRTEQGPPSEQPVPERWRTVLSEIVDRLVAADFEGLERDGIIGPVDDPDRDMVRHWIEVYPDALVGLPERAWELSHYWPEYEGPGGYSVLLTMWTAHQGPSDLTMEADVFDEGDAVRVEVNAVHVM